MSPCSETSVRPGGALVQRPVQGPDGNWYMDGRRISEEDARDYEYATRFWKRGQPETMRQNMTEIIEKAVQEGTFYLFVDQEEMTDEDKERISAYRVLAKQIGYRVGGFTHQPGKPTACAPIERMTE
jgi:hypothetical protein